MLLEKSEGIPNTRKKERKIGVLLINSFSMWKKHAWEVESLWTLFSWAQYSLMLVAKQQEHSTRTRSSPLVGKQILMSSQEDFCNL